MEPANRFPRTPCAPCILLLLTCFASTASAGAVTGIGIMGDSVLDEYQFARIIEPGGNRPDARSVSEILSAKRNWNFGAFTTADRGGPRFEGYEYNWAHEGSRTQDLVDDGQHTGLAAQVAAGKVDLVWAWAAANDWRDLYAPEIIGSPDPGAAVQAKVVAAATNVQIAIQTVLAANPAVNLVIANSPDLRALPALKAAIAATPGLDQWAAAVDQGIQAYNAQILALAESSDRIAMVDAYGISQAAVAGEPVQVGSLTLDTNVPGNGKHNYFVDALHPGTVAQGILANAFIDASNAEFDTGLLPLTAQEVTGIPLPTSMYAGMIGLAGAGLGVLRARRLRLAA